MVEYFSDSNFQTPSNQMEYFFGSHVIKPILPDIINKQKEYVDFQNDLKYSDLDFSQKSNDDIITKVISRLTANNKQLNQALMKISIQQIQVKTQKVETDVQNDILTVTEESDSSDKESSSQSIRDRRISLNK